MAMTVIGQWAVWLVLVFALAALMNKKPVETAAPAAFFVILLLYLGGLLGNLLFRDRFFGMLIFHLKPPKTLVFIQTAKAAHIPLLQTP